MKRRSFLTALAALAAAGTRRSLGQTQPPSRAAVVIGVDKVGNLPVLRAAASGATEMSRWLSGEGFRVAQLTDSTAPVTAHQVFVEVSRLVNLGTLEQLVIYFAGHGFIGGYSEYWLLSGAPDDPNEAVSVVESIVLAKQSSIPNVVIISDACRSRADSLQTEHVRGSLIFPNNRGRPPTSTDLDTFYATLVGDPSWESSVQNSVPNYSAIFTATLMDAYRRPANSMVVSVGGQNVVPNTRLKPYLLREVPVRAQAASIRLTQRPDVQVASGDSTYIGRVTTPERAVSPSQPEPPTIGDLADFALKNADSTPESDQYPNALRRLATVSGFSYSASQIFQSRGVPEDFTARTGIAVFGAAVKSATAAPGIRTAIAPKNANRTLISVELNNSPSGPVVLRFSDGSGCVLGLIRDYIANVVVDGRGVSSVSFEPSRTNPFYEVYQHERDRIADLHAVVATAARFGVFRVSPGADKEKDAAQLADRIRVLKGIDATLGIYAAYAYADADLESQVRSVRELMRSQYQVDLFDVALLANLNVTGEPGSGGSVVPFCPMLSRGWSLLRVKNAKLLPDLMEARDHLKDSLWSTFRPPGVNIIESLLSRGAQP